ncbi:MAG: hypothetical protein KC543_15000, partial [Myxococcales bacterium]|nr:hypothetical protein [Myxococcales bacterium]
SPLALDALGVELLEAPSPRSLVLPGTDFSAATWMQARAVAGARPDAALFIPGLATNSWHWRSLASHPLYDGRPRWGPGADASERLTAGALEVARGRVDIYYERPPRPLPDARVAGVYLALPSVVGARDTGRASAGRDDSLDARRLDFVLQAAQRRPLGDHDEAGATVRDAAYAYALRLLRRGDLARVGQTLRALLWELPPGEREGIRFERPLLRAPAPYVLTPRREALPLTFDETVRRVATLLDAAGATAAARALLRYTAARGDPRALLQLGWLELADGAPDEARRALDAFERVAPALRGEAASLAAALSPSAR